MGSCQQELKVNVRLLVKVLYSKKFECLTRKTMSCDKIDGALKRTVHNVETGIFTERMLKLFEQVSKVKCT